MKLYAIRNKNTGEIMDRWNSLANNAKIAKAGLAENGGYEIVTLRVEPTEPCDWCSGELFEVEDDYFVKYYEKEKKFMFARDFGGGILGINMVYLPCKLCPNCGRRLKDDNE